jgi:uncharacterized protein YjgD (DUF1641 family)
MSTSTMPLSTDERLDRLTEQLQVVTAELALQRVQRQRWAELLENSAPVMSGAMDLATRELADLEDKGYFSFARGGAAIVDRVVTSFSEDDVEALGDNIVLILNTIKEMTQPEVMNLLQRTALTAQGVDEEITDPPSVFALLKQMRDPQTRRGLARVMTMLRTVGAEESTPGPRSREEG